MVSFWITSNHFSFCHNIVNNTVSLYRCRAHDLCHPCDGFCGKTEFFNEGCKFSDFTSPLICCLFCLLYSHVWTFFFFKKKIKWATYLFYLKHGSRDHFFCLCPHVRANMSECLSLLFLSKKKMWCFKAKGCFYSTYINTCTEGGKQRVWLTEGWCDV